MWHFNGSERPSFAHPTRDGQESVWDYPRPPICVEDSRLVRVTFAGTTVAETCRSVRVLETASPPTFYIPRADIAMEYLIPASGTSYCEWKGAANYWTVAVDGQRAEKSAWSYHDPSERFASISGWLSFYPALVQCSVDGKQVRPQPGGFYGGWVTDEIIGPYKGDPGRASW